MQRVSDLILGLYLWDLQLVAIVFGAVLALSIEWVILWIFSAVLGWRWRTQQNQHMEQWPDSNGDGS